MYSIYSLNQYLVVSSLISLYMYMYFSNFTSFYAIFTLSFSFSLFPSLFLSPFSLLSLSPLLPSLSPLLPSLSPFSSFSFPFSSLLKAEQSHLEHVTVEYITLPGWNPEKTANKQSFKELPKNAQDYILKIEELVGVHGKSIFPFLSILTTPILFLLVEWVGTGPSREDIIHCPLN